jgi:hypothetical protein
MKEKGNKRLVGKEGDRRKRETSRQIGSNCQELY